MADGGDKSTDGPDTPLTKSDIPEVVQAVVAAWATSHKELGKL